MKKDTVNKTIKPSQRESITPFSKRFGIKTNADEKFPVRKAVSYVIVLILIFALIYIGFFFTDLFIKFSELPAHIDFSPEAISKWNSFLTIQG